MRLFQCFHLFGWYRSIIRGTYIYIYVCFIKSLRKPWGKESFLWILGLDRALPPSPLRLTGSEGPIHWIHRDPYHAPLLKGLSEAPSHQRSPQEGVAHHLHKSLSAISVGFEVILSAENLRLTFNFATIKICSPPTAKPAMIVVLGNSTPQKIGISRPQKQMGKLTVFKCPLHTKKWN